VQLCRVDSSYSDTWRGPHGTAVRPEGRSPTPSAPPDPHVPDPTRDRHRADQTHRPRCRCGTPTCQLLHQSCGGATPHDRNHRGLRRVLDTLRAVVAPSPTMSELSELLPTRPAAPEPFTAPKGVPAAIASAGPHAAFAWDEFFRGSLRNPHTRLAYGRAVHSFLAWLEPTGAPLTQVTPGMVGSYLDQLTLAPPSKKLTLAALRRFFDALVLRHVLILNPAASVRGERYERSKVRRRKLHPTRRDICSLRSTRQHRRGSATAPSSPPSSTPPPEQAPSRDSDERTSSTTGCSTS
jgi:hypothetical protein